MPRRTLVAIRNAALATLLLAPLASQSLDADPTRNPALAVTSNGAHHPFRQPTAVRRAFVVTGSTTWDRRSVAVEDSPSNPVDLVVDAGGHLVIRNCAVRVFGNVYLKEGGRIDISDSIVSLQNDHLHRFNYYWEGGVLSTRHTTIGGRKLDDGSRQLCVFQVDRGLWLANDTTIQFSAGILLGEGRRGFAGNRELRGGTLIADGLHQGESPDALVMSGMGDAVLRNSTFNVNFQLLADNAAPATVSLDLDTQNTIPLRVFGDPAVHDGTNRPPVDQPVPNSPFRLELVNVRVPFWWISTFETSMHGQPYDVTLRNTNGLLINVHGENLTGSPTPVGPWNQHYATIPHLPSHSVPGEHAIPPGCGVRIGNVTFRAPANDAARVSAWGLYLRGTGTNMTVRGATKLAEIFTGGGLLTIEGDDQYNGRVVANSIILHESGHVRIKNAAVGGMGLERYWHGRIVVHGVARCELDTVLTRQLVLTTATEWFWGPHLGVNRGTIEVRNAIELDPIQSLPTGQGSITVHRASATQFTDLQNLGFEAGVRTDGAPAFFEGVGISGADSTTRAPSSPGSRSFAYRSTQGSGRIAKQLSLSPGTRLSVSGWLRAASTIPGQLRVRIAGAGHDTVLTPDTPTGQWSWFVAPLHAVRTGDAVTTVSIEHSGNTGLVDVLVDDLRIHPHLWWESDNLANLDFEEPVQRNHGEVPDFVVTPDFWATYHCRTAIETNDRRPGSTGQRSVRIVPTGLGHLLLKDLTWLPPGRTITLRGYAKGIAASGSFTVGIAIGDGDRWWDQSIPSNRYVTRPANGAWHQFDIVYQVPAAPTFTRLALLGGNAGDTILYDDITVTLR